MQFAEMPVFSKFTDFRFFFSQMLLYKSIGKSAFSGNLQPFQDFLTTLTGISVFWDSYNLATCKNIWLEMLIYIGQLWTTYTPISWISKSMWHDWYCMSIRYKMLVFRLCWNCAPYRPVGKQVGLQMSPFSLVFWSWL